MKSRIGISQPKASRLAGHAQLHHSAHRIRIDIYYSRSDNFCRPVKIRVAANPTSEAARFPQIFAAGFNLNEPRAILRSLEAPPPLPRPARKVRKPIDWRICGGQDIQPEG